MPQKGDISIKRKGDILKKFRHVCSASPDYSQTKKLAADYADYADDGGVEGWALICNVTVHNYPLRPSIDPAIHSC